MAPEMAAAAERLGTVLLFAAAGMAAARLLKRSAAVVAVAGALAVALLFVPVNGLPLLAYIFAVIGPLGAASLVLLAAGAVDALAPAAALMARRGMVLLAAVVLIAASPFYPLVLGIGRFDPYALGFSGVLLPAGLGGLLVLAALLRAPAMAIWLACGLALFLADAYGSRNLLDYLLDPVAIPLAIITLVRALIARLKPPAGQPAISAKAATTSS